MTVKKDKIIKLIVGEDIGNGYLKGIINGEIIDKPAHAVKRYNTGFEKPIDHKIVDDIFKENVYDNIDTTISSPLVLDSVRRVLGLRAQTSGSPLEEFDVFSPQSKADVDLFGVLLLGSITSYVIQNYWKTHKLFPNEVFNVEVDLGVALPIMEFAKNKDSLRSKILNENMPHITVINNFDKPITLNIRFTSVAIYSEGEAAQKRIQNANTEFKDYLIKDARSRFPNGELDDVTGDDLSNLDNTLAIDIGEGTIDFAVFSNGQFNQSASKSVNHGYGLVLENALEILQSKQYVYHSRKELSEFLTKKPNKLTQKKWNFVKSIVDEEAEKFTDEIVSDTSRTFMAVGSFIEAIFISGGGSGPLEKWLFNKLQDLISSYGQEQLVPIIYLDSNYSRFLNAAGIYSELKKNLPNN